MIKKTLGDFLKMAVVFGAIFFLFLVGIKFLPEKQRNQWLYPNKNSALLSIEQEVILGEKMEKIFFDNHQEVNIKVIDSALWVILTRLEKQIEQSEYDYIIKVIDSPEINAFTIPGGRIYINRGLISFCDSPEQLAAVLAHEIGHVEKRHTVSKLIKEFGINLLFTILSGGDMILTRDLFHEAASTAFDRSYEKEADQFALELLEKAKISPAAIASFFRKMNRENLGYDEKIEFLMTHPHNNARIKRSLNHKTKDNFTTEKFVLNWEEVKREAQ